jgi:hypothetical protein
MRLDAVDDRALERACDAHADLEAARVGRLVSEQEHVERAGLGLERAHGVGDRPGGRLRVGILTARRSRRS